MSDLSDDLKKKVDQFLHYYEIFEEDGSCKAVRSHKLLRDIVILIPELQDEIDTRLAVLGFVEDDNNPK